DQRVKLGTRGLLVLGKVPGEDAFDGTVAGPTTVRAGERSVLSLRPGGFVVVLPRGATAWRGVGVDVARADGLPIAAIDEAHGLAVVARRRVAPGAVLGPFEPGTVDLDVYVAGE